MTIVPASRPKQDRAESLRLLEAHGVTDGLALLGVRGYYLRTMGAPDRNDRDLYDDAIALVTPSAHVTFNANVDPSPIRRGVASLAPGSYLYRLGIHGLNRPANRRYEALVQAAPVTVQRDGGRRESGWFGINIHRGGSNTTSSLGCQTIHPTQWSAFIALVKQEVRREGRRRIPYVLVVNG